MRRLDTVTGDALNTALHVRVSYCTVSKCTGQDATSSLS